MSIMIYEKDENGLSEEEIVLALEQHLKGRNLKKVLILPPDFTRYHSNAGAITNMYDKMLRERGCEVHIMPAVGTHLPVSKEEAQIMFGDIAYERLIHHDWKTDVVRLGEVPGEFLREKTDGLWTEPVMAEVNRLVMDDSYDMILSIGQVVPHVVVGMANHAKNLFVGVGGQDMISKSHMIGALYGMDRILGRDHTPVRELFDYAYEHFLSHRPIEFVLTVCTVPEGKIKQHGLFIGHGRDVLEAGIELAQKHNVNYVDKKFKKCVAYMDPMEFKSTWVADKALYRTCMAMEQGGELLVLAPGVVEFGEDKEVDALLRKYGYSGAENIMRHFNDPEDDALRNNMAAAAHLLQGSVHYGKFTVTYAVKKEMMDAVKAIGYMAADYESVIQKYNPEKMHYGWQTMSDGEEVFYIPAPSIGLWINKENKDVTPVNG